MLCVCVYICECVGARVYVCVCMKELSLVLHVSESLPDPPCLAHCLVTSPKRRNAVLVASRSRHVNMIDLLPRALNVHKGKLIHLWSVAASATMRSSQPSMRASAVGKGKQPTVNWIPLNLIWK